MACFSLFGTIWNWEAKVGWTPSKIGWDCQKAERERAGRKTEKERLWKEVLLGRSTEEPLKSSQYLALGRPLDFCSVFPAATAALAGVDTTHIDAWSSLAEFVSLHFNFQNSALWLENFLSFWLFNFSNWMVETWDWK